MVYADQKPDSFTLGMYQQLLEKAPLDYLEATEKYCQTDLYFVLGAIPDECFGDYMLRFHYTDQ